MTILDPLPSDGRLRPEIALAWKRAALTGLDPAMEVREALEDDDSSFDTRSPLLRAAAPVLTRLDSDLADSRFTVLVADENARIVDRRLSSRSPASGLERVKAVPGAHYREEHSGTNSLSTPFETGKPLAVIGDEHYLESLRMFACYGAPIIHPLTRRVAGVLDLTGPAGDASALLRPVLMRAVADIQDRLLEGSRTSAQQLLRAFRTAARDRRTAVVGYGDDLVLANDAAHDLLTPADHAILRSAAADLPAGGVTSHVLSLPSDARVRIHVHWSTAAGRSAVLSLLPDASDSQATSGLTRTAPEAVVALPAPVTDPGAPVMDLSAPATDLTGLVADHSTTVGDPTVTTAGRVDAPAVRVVLTGEAGTGRTTRALAHARALAGATDVPDLDPLVLSGRDAAVGRTTISDVLARLQDRQVLVVDDLHALPAADAAVVRSALERHTGAAVLTTETDVALAPAHRALLSTASATEILRPVREAGVDFPALVDAVLADLAAEAAQAGERRAVTAASGSQVRVAPSALEVLAEQEWPGNLTELRTVLATATGGRSSGQIVLTDVPASHRLPAARRLTPLERAERTAIVQALTAAEGNKKAAASQLGISRTTLYQRLRYYRITG